MDYKKLLSSNYPASVEFPAGTMADTKYVFSITYADPAALSVEQFSEAVRDAMHDESPDLARYPHPQGHSGLRELIAGSLEQNRGIKATAKSVFLSAGAGGAVQAILEAFVDPGDVVLVEEFSYLGTLRALLQRRANVIHIPTDSQGMDADALEGTIKELIASGRKPKLIYTISVYQNPMGMNLSLERRKRMLEISERFGVPILENESYADFRIDGEPLPPAMAGLEGGESVMYVSAYTKLLGCGLRLGFGLVSDQVRDILAGLRFGGSPSHLASMAVHRYLRDHADQHLRTVADSLRAKRDAMLAALDEHFPPVCTWNRPEGGMMVWVRLPEGADTWSVLAKAVEADVKYNPGPVFRAQRDGNNYLRLTYSHNTPEEIRDGIAILAEVFQHKGLFDPGS